MTDEISAAAGQVPTCRNCGYFVWYAMPKAPAEPGWVHTPYSPTKPYGTPCDRAEVTK